MNRKDNCTPFNSFEDNRKSLVRHTIQYFVMYSFGSVTMWECCIITLIISYALA